MRVAFDFNPVLINRFSGFYAYGAGLLRGFETLRQNVELLLFHSRRLAKWAELEKDELSDWAQLKATSIKMRWLENFWRYSSGPRLQFFTGEFDIYHSTHHLMPPTGNKPRVLTVHDLRRYKLPQLYVESKLDLFELAVKRADHFIAVSQSTKNDLCDLFAVPPEKVDVIHLAAHHRFEPASPLEKAKIKKRLAENLGTALDNYLIVFSSRDKRKNVTTVIKAFLSAQPRLPGDFKLVVVGSLPKNDETFESIISGQSAGSIVLTGPIDSIGPLLRCSEGLVFASLYEGFGIPVLEAFACGVPVIASNCSSMPEVAADAAAYVDPYDMESIAQAMIKVCSDSAFRRSLVESGYRRGKEFTWAKTAAKTIAVYNKLI